MDDIRKFLLEGMNNTHINLPGHIFLVKEYDRAFFTDTILDYESYEFEFHDQLVLPNGYVISKMDDTDKDDNFTCRLDSKELQLPLFVRTRKNGDRMEVKGLSGTKKISDIFTDEKVKQSFRNTWPIVVYAS